MLRFTRAGIVACLAVQAAAHLLALGVDRGAAPGTRELLAAFDREARVAARPKRLLR